jgi:uncharacterized protein (DUF2384 family)
LSDPLRKRRPKLTALSHEAGQRQGRIVRTAQAALGGVEAVRAFLNSHHAALNGRPLDLAVASEAGLIAVEAAIAREGRRAKRRPSRIHQETSP